MWRNGESYSEDGVSGIHGNGNGNGKGPDNDNGTGHDKHQFIAFVGHGVTVKGVINYTGTVKIDGHFEGEINTEGVLMVGCEAVINAQIVAGSVVSYGTIIGNITASDKVSLKAPGVFNGSVKAPVLCMEEGVIFTGQLEMSEKAPQLDRPPGSDSSKFAKLENSQHSEQASGGSSVAMPATPQLSERRTTSSRGGSMPQVIACFASATAAR
jgi:cytoskeletal protein CcmA (bactofilin family)